MMWEKGVARLTVNEDKLIHNSKFDLFISFILPNLLLHSDNRRQARLKATINRQNLAIVEARLCRIGKN
jgi:hypothetical protein